MNYVDFEAGNRTYKLRLNVKGIVELERKLGYNCGLMFGLDPNNPRFPTTEELIYVLHYSLQQFNHGITLNDTYEIFDNYINDGHMPMEFVDVIQQIFIASGILKLDVEEKN